MLNCFFIFELKSFRPLLRHCFRACVKWLFYSNLKTGAVRNVYCVFFIQFNSPHLPLDIDTILLTVDHIDEHNKKKTVQCINGTECAINLTIFKCVEILYLNSDERKRNANKKFVETCATANQSRLEVWITTLFLDFRSKEFFLGTMVHWKLQMHTLDA